MQNFCMYTWSSAFGELISCTIICFICRHCGLTCTMEITADEKSAFKRTIYLGNYLQVHVFLSVCACVQERMWQQYGLYDLCNVPSDHRDVLYWRWRMWTWFGVHVGSGIFLLLLSWSVMLCMHVVVSYWMKYVSCEWGELGLVNLCMWMYVCC